MHILDNAGERGSGCAGGRIVCRRSSHAFEARRTCPLEWITQLTRPQAHRRSSLLLPAALKARLSRREDALAQEYFVLLGTHLKESVAQHLPSAWWRCHWWPVWVVQCKWLHTAARFCPRALLSSPTGSLPSGAFDSLVRQAAQNPTKDMVSQPDLDTHVFCQVKADLGQVVVDDDG